MTVLALLLAACSSAPTEPPNILWLSCEDIGPHLGAYGDEYADTPNLDALATKGMIYTNASSNAPVCAPARTTIISGVYPTSLGAQHMRSMVKMPANMKMYPQYLREAGYYCTNNSKEDYNLEKPGQVWDESSRKAHWKNRAEGQPFFAIFNYTVTHESQIRNRPHTLVHDPAKARVPAYHPDTPEVRHDWAQYYDRITEMDAMAGAALKEIEEAGLAEDTIVFHWGDHGSGMPRNKRWPYNSGLLVPMIVHVPEKYMHLAPEGWQVGGKNDRPVAFVDLAPTVLSLAGIQPPEFMQGGAFLGKYVAPARKYNYGFRGRMDERYDCVRSVRDDRYMYLRHYNPHKVYGQYIAYMFQTPTTQVWKKMYDEGKLNEAQSLFWQTKPAEELYDLREDPDETKNLAGSPEHQAKLEELRKAERDWVLEIRDLGFLPEAQIHSRAAGGAPYDMGHDPQKYPMEKILAAAELASSLKEGVNADLVKAMGDDDAGVRYWGVMGFLMRGKAAVAEGRTDLLKALEDKEPSVQIAAAEALGRYSSSADVGKSLKVLMQYADPNESGFYLSMQAMNAIDFMGERARPVKPQLEKLNSSVEGATRPKGYVNNLKKKILDDLE